MKLTDEQLIGILKGIVDNIKILQDHKSSPNEFIEIDKLLIQFTKTKEVIYQSRGM